MEELAGSGTRSEVEGRVAIGEHMVATSALKIVKMCPLKKRNAEKQKTE